MMNIPVKIEMNRSILDNAINVSMYFNDGMLMFAKIEDGKLDLYNRGQLDMFRTMAQHLKNTLYMHYHMIAMAIVNIFSDPKKAEEIYQNYEKNDKSPIEITVTDINEINL